MIEILGKLSSAMRGFWWALDDDERLMLAGALLWTLSAAALAVTRNLGADREREERRELAALIADELQARAASHGG